MLDQSFDTRHLLEDLGTNSKDNRSLILGLVLEKFLPINWPLSMLNLPSTENVISTSDHGRGVLSSILGSDSNQDSGGLFKTSILAYPHPFISIQASPQPHASYHDGQC